MVTEQLIQPLDIPTKIPHILKYMGSKREILGFVTDAITGMDVEADWVCDLFAGTSVVAGALKDKFNIHANDVQQYSSILAHTYLSDLKSSIHNLSLDIILDKAEHLVREFKAKHSELFFDYYTPQSLDEFVALEKAQQALIDYDFKIGFHLFAKYYSGTYWSYEQCIWIDALRAVAESYKGRAEYYAVLSSLIFAMSYTSQSTGHYAQYRDVTESNMNDIRKYRHKRILPYFKKKFSELTLQLNGTATKEYLVTTLDYTDCLRIIPQESIVYADPPYQSVHYSRFYHALETLVKYDYPKVEHKGRYRDDRHQSPFCLHTKVKGAFIKLFKGIKEQSAHLALSYSDTGMVSFDEIRNLAQGIFANEYRIEALTKNYVHSNMGRKEERQQVVQEFILLAERENKIS